MPTIQELATDTIDLKLPVIADKDLTVQTSADTAKSYIVAPSPTGLWNGQAGNIAYYEAAEWRFLVPTNGMQVYVDDEDAIYVFNNSVWELMAGGGPVAITAATTLTKTAHAGRQLVVDSAAGIALTLPAATGSGDVYEFFIKTTISSSSTTIKVANASDSMLGGVFAHDTDAAGTGKPWKAAANDDTITLNGTATGGKAGDWVRVKDIATNLFIVEGFIAQSGGSEATPFSATV